MIDRDERRALAAFRHVLGAEIIDDIDAGQIGEELSVAELHRQAGLRAMQHRLAVKADHADLLARHRVLGEKRLDRIGVNFGDELLGRGQNAGPVGAVGEPGRRFHRLAQKGALLVGVIAAARRTEGFDPLAVRFDQRNIHPVHRGAAHQSDCFHHMLATTSATRYRNCYEDRAINSRVHLMQAAARAMRIQAALETGFPCRRLDYSRRKPRL